MSNNHETRGDENAMGSLAALKSTFAFPHRTRPQSSHMLNGNDGSTSNGRLIRSQSKGGLRNMFSRTKLVPDLPSILSTDTDNTVHREALPERTPATKSEPFRTLETPRPAPLPPTAPPVVTITPASKSSRIMGMRSRSNLKQKAIPLMNAKLGNITSPTAPRPTMAAWDPPPLFQAYPQAIKYAQLSSSTLSADSILRLSNQKGTSNTQDGTVQGGLGRQGGLTPAKKSEKARNKHQRQVSGSLSKVPWTEKIYVLVTSGYLLQYSASGSFDRLPEKMMQLGRDSVAFASDVIPGKHWVLQISQAMDSDGTPAPDARSLMSRLTFRGVDYRRTATSLLLVLESAEELESWITIVRREIEALGGKSYVPETGNAIVEEEQRRISQINGTLSPRYLVKRDPDRFSNPPTPKVTTFNPPWDPSPDNDSQETMTAYFPKDAAAAPSDSLSIATSVTSHDDQLDSLRDSVNRHSYMSSGTRTLVTSRGSSPMSSPTLDSFPTGEERHSSEQELRFKSKASAIADRRRSMQTIQTSGMDFRDSITPARQRPHSTFLSPGPNILSQTPTTPNFSIPHAVSKRYTLAKSSSNGQIGVGYSNKPAEAMLKGNRKSPPAPLSARPLSPVEDQPSPVKPSLAYSPTESSLSRMSQRKPIVINTPPQQSPGKLTPNLNANTPKRHSSYAQIGSQPSFPIPTPRRSRSNQSLYELSNTAKSSPSTQSKSPHSTQTLSPRPSPKATRATLATVSDALEDFPSPAPAAPMTSRRPMSMQVRTNTPKPLSFKAYPANTGKPYEHKYPFSKSASMSFTSNYGQISPPTSAPMSTMAMSPSLQRIKVANRALTNRRSMPHLINGPPPAPPPNCALPPLPVSRSGIH